jgi:SAM-dependent methyltransferase
VADLKDSDQDRCYMESEGDNFFARNMAHVDPSSLRPKKLEIAERIKACGISPQRVIEYGCNYGDLLKHYADAGLECFGVEASSSAVTFGREHYGSSVELIHGSIADNALNREGGHDGFFDLVIIDDVFCWVSRETILQSIANIDAVLAEGGHLFIREFFPARSIRNRNHHVVGQEVYCYKLAGLHAGIFTATNTYEVVARQVWTDECDSWVDSRKGHRFESRWVDSILRKSTQDYFAENLPPG